MTAWNEPDRPLILASQSPRRRQLLATMGLSFEVTTPDIGDEEAYFGGSPVEAALQRLARAKADSVARTAPESLVLGGDTVVVVGDRIIGKPAGRESAREMLQTLSGRCHQVVSGVALVCDALAFSVSAVACTDVRFRAIDTWEIERYLEHEAWSDKAGAYAIQGKAMTFVDRIEGCFYNVVGLPISATIGLFMEYTNRKDTSNG
jgi:septum formation protein